ncbi:CRISPR-associated helicase Cas3' [Streptomyces sp. SL13]|uniref:CRISPR-associated helicase Cas3 n=1 Tax=Streptantibioticus silvisoli TaxID=2705255 RepID=A0AA90HBF5_9ACTN|nr:CRISPR-associated helicase Cas3' [Streptantibioticus silvisoli]MDI5973729.1 CRISPR-associated helicase Cas3' [Streptantibioticus silvisoli]
MNTLRAKGPKNGHPGELLTAHLLNTLTALHTIRRRIGSVPGVPGDFWVWAALAALLHDPGKIPDGFQRMIGNTPEPVKIWGERHEVLSLGFSELLLAHLPEAVRDWVGCAIVGHHRPYYNPVIGSSTRTLLAQYSGDAHASDFLNRFTPADEQRLAELVRWLHTTGRENGLPLCPAEPTTSMPDLVGAAFGAFTRLMDRWQDVLAPDDPDGRTATLLLGVVTMADHLSSAHSPLDADHPLTADYPATLDRRLAADGHTVRPQQRAAGATSGHLLLRSWTGSGKTEGVLLWAVRQVAELSSRCGGTPRVFYLLPYLASIDAMTGRLETELDAAGRIGVAHSKAASYHLARSLEEGCPEDTDTIGDGLAAPAIAAVKAHSRAQATRNFRELLRVGTPYQLLRGVLAGPVHSSLLADSANSVFILDELHAYDTRRLGMILAIMSFWENTGGRIAVMSATLPERLAKLVTCTLKQKVPLVEAPPDTPAPVRHRLHLREHHLTASATLDEVRAELDVGHSVLVIANNVRDAVDLYEELGPYCTERHGEDSAHLLHSRFRRMDRDRIEGALLARFGAGTPRRPGLLVGTQALEVSLNLDLDICHTSAADLEALVQRFGRVNRLGHLEPAPVIVHRPLYTPRRGSGDQLFADGVYDKKPTQLGWNILTRHDGRTIDEQTVTTWLDEVYESEWGDTWRQEVEFHRGKFNRVFLTFTSPFADRSHLADAFDEQFDGTEAILLADRDDYGQALNCEMPDRATGRIHASRYLIPLPAWVTGLARYDKALRVRTINADYDPRLGLRALYHDGQQNYRPGEVI